MYQCFSSLPRSAVLTDCTGRTVALGCCRSGQGMQLARNDPVLVYFVSHMLVAAALTRCFPPAAAPSRPSIAGCSISLHMYLKSDRHGPAQSSPCGDALYRGHASFLPHSPSQLVDLLSRRPTSRQLQCTVQACRAPLGQRPHGNRLGRQAHE